MSAFRHPSHFVICIFQAGTLLAIGIISSGIQDTCDPAAALLMDHINSDRTVMRIGSIFGLGLAYANSKRLAVLKKEDGGVVFELKKVLSDARPSATSEVSWFYYEYIELIGHCCCMVIYFFF